jgi:multidrug efflux pump
VFGGFKMSQAHERDRPQWDVQGELQGKLFGVTGFQVSAFPRPSLPSPGRGLPIQFVLMAPFDDLELNLATEEILSRAMQSGKFMFLQKSVEFNRPQTIIDIDRDRAGILGIEMESLGTDLATLLGGNHINWFNLQGRSYKVIPQVENLYRANSKMLADYHVRTSSGDLVPLSSVASFRDIIEPSERLQFQQRNAITLQGVPASGVAMGDAIE